MPPAAPRDPDLEALAAQNARVRSLALAIARDAPPGGRPGSRCLGSVAAPSPRRPEQPVGLVGEGQRNFLRHSARDEAHRKDRELVAAEFLEDCSADRCRERLHRPILDAVSELKEPSRRVLPPDGGGRRSVENKPEAAAVQAGLIERQEASTNNASRALLLPGNPERSKVAVWESSPGTKPRESERTPSLVAP